MSHLLAACLTLYLSPAEEGPGLALSDDRILSLYSLMSLLTPYQPLLWRGAAGEARGCRPDVFLPLSFQPAGRISEAPYGTVRTFFSINNSFPFKPTWHFLLVNSINFPLMEVSEHHLACPVRAHHLEIFTSGGWVNLARNAVCGCFERSTTRLLPTPPHQPYQPQMSEHINSRKIEMEKNVSNC